MIPEVRNLGFVEQRVLGGLVEHALLLTAVFVVRLGSLALRAGVDLTFKFNDQLSRKLTSGKHSDPALEIGSGSVK